MASHTAKLDINKEVKDLPPNWVVLVSTDNVNYLETCLDLFRIIESNKGSGVYITINRPYTNIVETLDSKKIKYDSVYFIDCITETAGGTPTKSEKVLYMASPQSLTDLGVAIDELMHLLKDRKNVYLILDSISMLLIYNNHTSVVEFIHFISSKMRIFNIKGALINIDDQNDSIATTLMQFCDKEIKVK